MISLLFILFFAGSIFFLNKTEKTITKFKNNDNGNSVIITYFVLFIISGIVSIIFFIWILTLFYTVGTGHIYEEKIRMYEESNSYIEEQMDVIVSNYMDFESSTYNEFKDKDESSISLVECIPELESKDLVQQQIRLYWNNRYTITYLKEEQIDLSKARWLLYFGK